MTAAMGHIASVLRVADTNVHPGRNARGQVGDVTELAVSIKAIGQQEPLLVYQTGPVRYEVFDGHRRLAAIRQARIPYVDIIVRDRPTSDLMRIQQQLAMHAQSQHFDPMAEAEALEILVLHEKLRPELVARAMGKSSQWVSNRLGLLNLNPTERAAVRDGRMPLREAASIVANRRASRDGRVTTPLTVRQHCRTCTCEVP